MNLHGDYDEEDEDLGPLPSDIGRTFERRLLKENARLRAEVERLTDDNARLVGDLVRAVDRSSFNMLTAALAGAFDRKTEDEST